LTGFLKVTNSRRIAVLPFSYSSVEGLGAALNIKQVNCHAKEMVRGFGSLGINVS